MKSSTVLPILRNLFKGNHEEALSGLKVLEAEETRAGNANVAAAIRRLQYSESCQRSGFRPGPGLIELPKGAPSTISMVEPARGIDSLVLNRECIESLRCVLLEASGADDLHAHGIRASSKLLFHGPSGNGKTAAAEALAFEMKLPLAIANYAELIDSHVGATGRVLGEAMKYARSIRCVMLFDEADSIVCKRLGHDSAASIESSRIVNQVLTDLDRAGDGSLFIFATNFNSNIDLALIRRMDSVVEFRGPTEEQKLDLIRKLLSKWDFVNQFEAMDGIESLTSFAAIEGHVLKVAKRHILLGRNRDGKGKGEGVPVRKV